MKRTIKKRRTKSLRTGTSDNTGGDHAPFQRGAEGFATAKVKRERQEEEYEKQKNTPFDFRLKPGDEATVVIVDTEEPFFVTLHKLKGANGRWTDEVCIADTGTACPLCSMLGKEGSYTMVLTALDKRKYTVKSGPNAGKVIKVSKKLMKVKSKNMPKFERQYNKYGSFLGLKVMCHRTGDKEAAIGEDLEFLGRVKAVALKRYKEYAEPADYETIFAAPSADELRKRYSITSQTAGSSEFGGGNNSSSGSSDYDIDDDIPF